MIKLSYLVSTYNSGHYLDRHIADLLQYQTDPNFEIVVMNPHSPGTDHFIAEKWAATDSRVKYHYWPEREWYGTTWLRCWQLANGEFVVNSNTDDSHHPDFTSDFYNHMKFAITGGQIARKIGFSYAGLQVVNDFGQILGGGLKPPFDFELMSRECYAGPQVCWRNDQAFKDSLDFNYLFKRSKVLSSGFDYFLWLYFMSKGYHGHVIPKTLTVYTQRANSIENSNKWANNWDTFTSIAEFFPHHFQNVLKKHKEFANFPRVPARDQWIEVMQRGDKWRDDYEWQVMDV